MTLTNQKTLAEIAAASSSAVRVFEKYQIDYCCGGSRSLDEACREKGIPPDQLIAELEQAPPLESRDWTSPPLTELTDHIVATHHTYLQAELPALGQMVAKVVEAHGRNHADTLLPLEEVFGSLKAELESHMMKEEMILFPLIKSLEAARKAGAALPPAHCGSVNNPIRVMEIEHDNAGAALKQIRLLSAEYTAPADGCETYRALFRRLAELEADLHLHIHLENNVLFPRARRLEAQLPK